MPETCSTAWIEMWLLKTSEIYVPQIKLLSEILSDHNRTSTDEKVNKSQES